MPYPQGPRTNDGTGTLITGGSNFNGGGFYTGYWLTTGDPVITGGGQPYGKTSNLTSAIFVGGWYSKSTKIAMGAGTSGVYVSPCTNQNSPLLIIPQIEIPTEDNQTPALTLHAWPNPTDNEIIFEVEGTDDEKNVVTVYDMLGAKVLQLETVSGQSIRFGSELQAGVYFIHVRQGQGSNSIRVIKQSSY
ncbi:MAG: T9SS type A sorting domain-containing protein [Bacteroidota bacterium]|nr:T9SS type A sorting domain-containing protein [Bacteroidota bacterium]